ncbi:MAG: hypothetical protein C0597_10970, partial [Marinilabiliales bacterium]
IIIMQKLLILLGVTISFNLYSQTQNSIQQIELMLFKRHYDSVAVIAKTALEKDSANWLLHYYYGKSYQAMYKYFEAIECYEKALKLDSANSIIENELAEAYDFVGKDEDAIHLYYNQYIRDTIKLEPIVSLANIFRKNKEFGSAIHYYQKATSIDPENFYYYKQQAYCYDKISIPAGAINTYYVANMLNPFDLSIYVQLANILNTERNFASSINICRQGLEYHQDNAQLMKLQSYAYYLNRDFDSSIIGFNKLLENGDSSYFILKYQGLAFFENKNFENAIEKLEEAYEINSKDPETCFYLGSAFGRTGYSERGMELLNRSQSLLKPSPVEISNILSEMAFIFQEQKEYELALEHLKSAYKYNSDPILSFKMAQLYDILGSKKLAINYYDGFLIMANPQESDDIEIQPDTLVFKDQAMIKHAVNRIRTLKEEMFFEEGN